MRKDWIIPGSWFLAALLQIGCPTKEPVVTVPVMEKIVPQLSVNVLSTPSQATISLKDHPLGVTPQSISVETASDLLQLKAVLGESEAAEKRIRFLSPERAEVHFLFGKNQSPLARSLGLSKVLVFDYGDGITFAVNQHELRPEFASLLERQAEMLKAYFTNLDIYVCGHTDSSGNLNQNLALSLARAQAVANDLISKGVPRSRLKVQGFGSAFPVASNETPEGKALNRRTEIVLPQ
jgi:outer membrane protein OmpA-like peptidoglycan-associated protein